MGLRRLYSAAILLAVGVGVFTFVLSDSTDRLFAWTIDPPLTAAFLGASYWAASFLAYFSSRERIWANARLSYSVAIVFTTLTMTATLAHLDKFHDNAGGWLWTIVYVGVPPLLVVLLVLQLRSPGADPPRHSPIERRLLPFVFLQLVVAFGIGGSLFLFPSTADDLWPWPLTPLTSQMVGAWLLTLAAGLASMLYERDWARARVAVATFTALPVLQAVALGRYRETVDWSSARLWLYLASLGSLLVLGLYGIRRTWLPRALSTTTG